MSRPTEILQQIETPRFSAEVNLASGVNGFLRAVRSHYAFRQMLGELQSGVIDAVGVHQRVLALLSQRCDPSFEHPADAALAAYVCLLDEMRSPLASDAAARVRKCENCWWARKVAERIAARSIESRTRIIHGQTAIDYSDPQAGTISVRFTPVRGAPSVVRSKAGHSNARLIRLVGAHSASVLRNRHTSDVLVEMGK